MLNTKPFLCFDFGAGSVKLGEFVAAARRGFAALHAAAQLEDAMKQVLDRHYPVYPVVDAENRLRGLVRGPAALGRARAALAAL